MLLSGTSSPLTSLALHLPKLVPWSLAGAHYSASSFLPNKSSFAQLLRVSFSVCNQES